VQLLEALGDPMPRILDVGCATGVALEVAATLGWGTQLLAGVDASERAIEEAEVRLKPLGDRVHLQRCAADALPFVDQSIDVVTCNGVIKYMDAPTFARFLRESLRALRVGGSLALGEFGPRVKAPFPNLWRVSAIEDRLLRPAPEIESALMSAGFSDVQRVDVARIRRFPYSYVGVVARRSS